MIIIKNDWKSKFNANPFVNQKNILNMLDMRRMAHTSMENDPNYPEFLIFLY